MSDDNEGSLYPLVIAHLQKMTMKSQLNCVTSKADFIKTFAGLCFILLTTYSFCVFIFTFHFLLHIPFSTLLMGRNHEKDMVYLILSQYFKTFIADCNI